MSQRSSDNLYDEMVDVHCELSELVEALIKANWDSDTLKQKIIITMTQGEKLHEEIQKLEAKKNEV